MKFLNRWPQAKGLPDATIDRSRGWPRTETTCATRNLEMNPMKTSKTLAACGLTLALVSPLALGAEHGMQGMKHDHSHAAHEMADRHMAKGKVVRANPDRGRVTVTHEPVASLNWPTMTMGFRVENPALFDKLGVGAEVDFEFKQDGRNYIITDVR